MAFDRLVQAALGPPIRGGDQLVIHLHELIEGLVVRLHEEADQHGVALGRVEEAEALRHSPAPRAGRGLSADCC